MDPVNREILTNVTQDGYECAGCCAARRSCRPAFAQNAPQQTQRQINSFNSKYAASGSSGRPVEHAQATADDISVKNAPQQARRVGLGRRLEVGIVNGRPTLYSTDGRNSIAIVGRSNSMSASIFSHRAGPTPPTSHAEGSQQRLQSAACAARHTGTYASDWKFDSYRVRKS